MKLDLAIPNTADIQSLQGRGGGTLCCHRGHPPSGSELGGHSSRCRQTFVVAGERGFSLAAAQSVWGNAELHLPAGSTRVIWIPAGLDAKHSETIYWEPDSFLGCVLCHSCSKLVLIQGHLHPGAEFGLEFYNESSDFFAFPECLELFFLMCWNMKYEKKMYYGSLFYIF